MRLLLSLSILGICLFSCSPKIPQLPDKSLPKKERILQYLQAFEKEGYTGTVLVAEKGEILIREAYGKSDQDGQLPNTPETIFDIGSITKQFTAAAILKLEMQGKLNVEDKASQYLPELTGQLAPISIHQLLTHTAGFPGAIGSDKELTSRGDYFKRLNSRPLKQPPGEKYAYSNVGYTLLALIIEERSGMSYEAYLRQELFLPAGMEKTGYILPTWEEGEQAHGYKNTVDKGIPTEQNWDENGPGLHLMGNGGILSHVDDMYAWHLALLDDKILSKEAKTKLYAQHTPEPGGRSFYGYGWVVFPTSWDTQLITHNGGNGIFFADFLRFIDDEVCIIFFSNSANKDVERIAFSLAKMMFQD